MAFKAQLTGQCSINLARFEHSRFLGQDVSQFGQSLGQVGCQPIGVGAEVSVVFLHCQPVVLAGGVERGACAIENSSELYSSDRLWHQIEIPSMEGYNGRFTLDHCDHLCSA